MWPEGAWLGCALADVWCVYREFEHATVARMVLTAVVCCAWLCCIAHRVPMHLF